MHKIMELSEFDLPRLIRFTMNNSTCKSLFSISIINKRNQCKWAN